MAMAWIWLTILFIFIVYINLRTREGFAIEEKTNGDFFNRDELTENQAFLSRYRQTENNPKIIDLLDKYATPNGVSTDLKLIRFFLDVQPILGTLDNCHTIKGYPVLFISVLGPIYFMPYNEVINRYPRMIRRTKDYTMLKNIYTSSHNLITNQNISQTCGQLMKTVCSSQISSIVQAIEDGVYYFVAKSKAANEAVAMDGVEAPPTDESTEEAQ
jgi:hypothetical protein